MLCTIGQGNELSLLIPLSSCSVREHPPPVTVSQTVGWDLPVGHKIIFGELQKFNKHFKK